MDEKPEKPEKTRLIAKEDVTPLVMAAVCLLITLYLFFGPSPVKSLFPDRPATAVKAEPVAPQGGATQAMMPAAAVPEPAEPAEQPEAAKKAK